MAEETGKARTLLPERWFETPIWSLRIKDHQRINADILAALRLLEGNGSSIARSNMGGWHSHDQIHHEAAFAELSTIIGNACVGCAKFMEFDFENFDLVITHMWVNKNGPGDFNKPHIHPNALLSGAYYVQTPDKCGNIELYDPVPARLMLAYPIRTQKPSNSTTIEYECQEGLLLVFPSWLLHSVQPNRSQDSRVSISFNIGFRPSPRSRNATNT